MKNKTLKTVIILLTLYAIILLVAFLISNSAFTSVGMVGIAFAFCAFFIGAILCFINDTHDIGLGIVISSLIIGIIGFGVCTANFRVH